MARTSGIGEILVRAGLIDSVSLARAREAEQAQKSLIQAIVSLGLANEEQIAAAMARHLRLDALEGDLPEVTVDVAALVPAAFCRSRGIVPLALQGKTLRVALSDPTDYSSLQDIEFRTGKRIVAIVAMRSQIEKLIQQTYPEDNPSQLAGLTEAENQGEVETVGETEIEVVDPSKLTKETQLPPVVRLVNSILSGAAKAGASDIHMEPK